jgi:hypothetical protein
VLPVGQRYSGKNETHGIERDNARQRHWLARFRRRSIVVSKTRASDWKSASLASVRDRSVIHCLEREVDHGSLLFGRPSGAGG